MGVTKQRTVHTGADGALFRDIGKECSTVLKSKIHTPVHKKTQNL